MDRFNFYYRQKVKESELDELQDHIEAADRRIILDTVGQGIITGGAVTQRAAGANLSVDVDAMIAYDALGRRVAWDAPGNADCSKDHTGASTAVTTGQERWITVTAQFRRVETDERVDGLGQTVLFHQAESYLLRVLAGAAAATGNAVKPTAGANEIILCDVKITPGKSTIVNADINTDRRPIVVYHTADQIRLVDSAERFAGASVEEALVELDDAATVHEGKTTAAHGGIAPATHVGSGGTAHAAATTSANGFMSKEDKTKLDGIAAGAGTNQPAFGKVKVGGSTIAATTTTDTVELVAGTNVTLTPDGTGKKVTIASTAAQNAYGTVKVGATSMAANSSNTTLELVAGTGIVLTADAATRKVTVSAKGRQLYAGDETEKYVTGTTAATVKEHRVCKSTGHGLNVTKLHVLAEIYRSSGTGYLDVYVDGSLAFTLSTTSASYQLVQGETAVSWSDNTVHLVTIKLRGSGSTYKCYNRLYELYVEVE